MSSDKLIAIDVDGTLINHKTTLLPEVAQRIIEIKNSGIDITLATGRMASAALTYIEALEIDLPVVALNGVFVGSPIDATEPIYHEPVSNSSLNRIIDVVEDIPVSTVIAMGNKALGRNINDITKPALDSWIVNISPYDRRNIDKLQNASIILIAGDEKSTRNAKKRLENSNLVDVDIFFFPSIRYFPMHYLEIRSRGTNKGKGLAMLAEELGYKRENIIAIGDYLNDISMRDTAGFFGAPANAHEEVVKIADYVSEFTNDETAVVDIIEKALGLN